MAAACGHGSIARPGRRALLTLALGSVLAVAGAGSPPAGAEPPISLVGDTRYMALGDSLSAGYGAIPTTLGFTYQLLHRGVIDSPPHTIFAGAAVPGARSEDVLAHQVPQVPLFFKDTGVAYRKVITLTVGGNDLLVLLGPVPPDPQAVAAALQALAGNLAGILATLLAQFPDVEIYVGNLYDPQLPIAGSDLLVLAVNDVIAQVASGFPGTSVHLVDVYGAFQGRSGLLLSERSGADPLEVHPSNAGYRAMANAFAGVIRP